MSSLLTPEQLDHYHEQGYLLLPSFLDSSLLANAKEALWQHYPTPERYHANPDDYPKLGKSQFAGLIPFPWSGFALNRLVVTHKLIEIAAQILESDDIRLTKAELWAKYQGAINYDQGYHRDFGNHTLLVPRRDHRYKELTTFLFLSDVTKETGATALIPRTETDHLPFSQHQLAAGSEMNKPVYAEGPAGSLLLYSYDVFHRGRELTEPDSARFMVLADFARRDAPWIDRHAWPHHGLRPEMNEFLAKIDVRQRNLMDFPPPGHEYWNEQTLNDVQQRYPDMDMTPYKT